MSRSVCQLRQVSLADLRRAQRSYAYKRLVVLNNALYDAPIPRSTPIAKAQEQELRGLYLGDLHPQIQAIFCEAIALRAAWDPLDHL